MVCYLSSQAPMGGGGWAEKISCTIRGEGKEKYLGQKI